MSQSSIIAAGLIIGFIVFITVKGQLSQYLGVLGIGANAVSAPSTSSTSASISGVSIGNFGLGTGILGATSTPVESSLSTGVSSIAPIGSIPGASPSLTSTTIGSMQPLPTAPTVPTSPTLTLNDGTDLYI